MSTERSNVAPGSLGSLLQRVFERARVGRDHAGARAGFDRHVADGHALVHRHGLDRRTAELEHVAGAAGDADLADDGEDQVLGRHAFGQPVHHIDCESLGLALQQALRGQYVADFGGADAEGESAERAVSRRVAVTANNGLAGLSKSEFGPDDVHDAAPAILEIEQFDAELGGVDLELLDLLRRGIDRDGHATEYLLGARGRRVVHRCDGQIRAAQLEPAQAQLGVRLRSGHFMREVKVDEQYGGRIGGLGNDQVVVPDLFKHCLRLHMNDELVSGETLGI
jgi:hypothetical protein